MGTVRWIADNHRTLTVLACYLVAVRLAGSWTLATVGLLSAGIVWSVASTKARQRQQVREGMRRSPWWRVWRDVWVEEARRQAVTARWSRACHGQGLHARRVTPGLYKMRRTPAGDLQAVISSRSGVPVTDVERKRRQLAQVVGCRELLVTTREDGTAIVEFRWSDVLQRTVHPHDLTPAPKGHIAIGRLDDGELATVRVLNRDGESVLTPTLIGAVSGGGKSGALHAIIAGFIAARIPLAVYVYDPAGGVELAMYEDHLLPYAEVDWDDPPMFRVGGYATTARELKDMLGNLEADRHNRLKRIKAERRRAHVPTPREPVTLLVVDELTGVPADQRKTDTPLHRLLAQGRKSAHSAVVLTQLAEKQNIGDLRELFARRIVLATKTRQQTEAVIGASGGDTSTLPPAHDIPENTPGVFFMDTGRRSYTRGRFAFYDDEAVERIAAGELPDRMRERHARPTPCAVYRFYSWDADTHARVLEYVGKSLDPADRLEAHAAEAAADPTGKGLWWARVQRFRQMDEGRDRWMTIGWYDSEPEALEAEREAIERELPRMNKVHNGRNPLRARHLESVA